MSQSKPLSNSDNQSTSTDGETQQPIIGEQTVEQLVNEQAEDELTDDDDYDDELPKDRNHRLMILDPLEEHLVLHLNWKSDIAAQAKESEDVRQWIASLTPEELAQEFPPF